jgi:hypothetical protein
MASLWLLGKMPANSSTTSTIYCANSKAPLTSMSPRLPIFYTRNGSIRTAKHNMHRPAITSSTSLVRADRHFAYGSIGKNGWSINPISKLVLACHQAGGASHPAPSRRKTTGHYVRIPTPPARLPPFFVYPSTAHVLLTVVNVGSIHARSFFSLADFQRVRGSALESSFNKYTSCTNDLYFVKDISSTRLSVQHAEVD